MSQQQAFEILYEGAQPGHSFHPESVDRVVARIRDFILAEQLSCWEDRDEPPTACLITVNLEFH